MILPAKIEVRGALTLLSKSSSYVSLPSIGWSLISMLTDGEDLWIVGKKGWVEGAQGKNSIQQLVFLCYKPRGIDENQHAANGSRPITNLICDKMRGSWSRPIFRAFR